MKKTLAECRLYGIVDMGYVRPEMVEACTRSLLAGGVRVLQLRAKGVGLEEVRLDGPDGPTLAVSGADLMDGTPIFDIKPYLPYTDCHPDAAQGLGTPAEKGLLKVDFPAPLLEQVPLPLRGPLLDLLAQDPRPGYQRSADREYWMAFGGMEVGFTVEGEILRVTGAREGGPRKG